MSNPKILYAGDSWEGGPANYLLGVLKSCEADFLHVPAAIRMSLSILEKKFDAIILSDYSRALMPDSCQARICELVEQGTGLLMIGGWASFSGPFGNWKDSQIEKLLPVQCDASDDRMNIMSGALIIEKQQHPMFAGLNFDPSPVLCGMNKVHPKAEAQVLLSARKIIQDTGPAGKRIHLSLGTEEHPLFVIRDDKIRTAALATDVAPHWCGGLVDWGEFHQKLRINPKIEVEVGNRYIQFLTSLLFWLSRTDRPSSSTTL